jgi:RIO kinase 1
MRVPKSLETLADDGIIEQVVRPLMSGKEAHVYLVIANGQQYAAKIYKDAQSRSFKNRADYTEGRKVRNSRDQRAISRGTKYGKSQDESAWKSTEVEMIYRLRDAGVRVPIPHTFIDGVLVMELVADQHGNPAPRLGDLEFSPQEATEIYHQLLGEVIRLLCAGVVHGDLSEFNVLLAADGPVLIDFPQSVNAAQNLNARQLLIRDVDNLHRFLARWVPRAPRRRYAEEMWSLYESSGLTPETQLTGNFRQAQGPVDTSAVLSLIGEANRDEAARRRARGQSTSGLEPAASQPMRRREVVVERPAVRQVRGRGPAREGQPREGRPREGQSGDQRFVSRGGPEPRRSNGARNDSQRHDSRPRRPGEPSRPKRGDSVQASTYVSPEARRTKVQKLTPRDGSGASTRDSRQVPPSAQRTEGAKPGGERNGSGRRRRSRRSPRANRPKVERT